MAAGGGGAGGGAGARQLPPWVCQGAVVKISATDEDAEVTDILDNGDVRVRTLRTSEEGTYREGALGRAMPQVSVAGQKGNVRVLL